MSLEVGKGDAIVNSSTDALTTCIYDFDCVDFNCILQFIKKVSKKSLKGFAKETH